MLQFILPLLIVCGLDTSVLPSCSCLQLEHQAYTVCFDTVICFPKWITYRLTKRQSNDNRVARSPVFTFDPLVGIDYQWDQSDYNRTGYDKGHIAPAEDFRYNQQLENEVFYLTNITPQLAAFNRGIWKKLENHVRDLVQEDTILYVTAGPIFSPKPKKVGKSKMPVPVAFYKIIKTEDSTYVYLIPNARSSKALSKFRITLDSLTKRTNIDFRN